MGVFDFVKSGVREMMIARPDAQKHLIVYKHPDQNIPMYSQLTVDMDECAVFFRDGGRNVGVLPPGRHTLQSQNIPFLNNFINSYTGGNVFIAEVYFVKMAPLRGVTFGGPVGYMPDPMTKTLVTPRIFGEFSLAVQDPVKFIVGYHGQAAGLADNDATLDWVRGLFMNGVKQALGDFCIRQKTSILFAAASTMDLARAFVSQAPALDDIGVRILQMGQFNLNFSPEDEKKLHVANEQVVAKERELQAYQFEYQKKQMELDQKFQNDARYVRELAGNYQGYAAGQALMGAGQGMAQHGVGDGIAGVGAQAAVGVGMAQMMMGAMQPGAQPVAVPGPSPSTPGPVACPACKASQPGGKFCAECGAALAPPKKFCNGCGSELVAQAKFCASCGSPAGGAPVGG